MCSTCTDYEWFEVCPACRARGVALELPFTAQNFSVMELFTQSLRVYGRNWLPFTAASAIVVGFVVVSQTVPGLYELARATAGEQSSLPRQLASGLGWPMVGSIGWGLGTTLIGRFALRVFDGKGPSSESKVVSEYWPSVMRAVAASVILTLPVSLITAAQILTARSEEPLTANSAGIAILVIYVLTLPFWYLVFPLYARNAMGLFEAFGEVLRATKRHPAAVIGGTALLAMTGLLGLFVLCIGMVPATAICIVFSAALSLVLMPAGER